MGGCAEDAETFTGRAEGESTDILGRKCKVGIMSVAAIAVMQYGALAWCYVLLRKEGASSSSLIAVALIFKFKQPSLELPKKRIRK